MKPKFLLVQLSAFSLKLIERFAREFGLDAIIQCSAEYCPKVQKVHFRLTCVRLKTSLLKLTTIKMLKPFCQDFPTLLYNIMQTVVSPLLVGLITCP